MRLQIPVFVRGLDIYGEEFLELTKTLDISVVGACLASPRPLRLHQFISLRIPAPSVVSAGVVPETTPPIAARVVRERAAGDLQIVGVEFTKPLE
jgi:hypothetical protein